MNLISSLRGIFLSTLMFVVIALHGQQYHYINYGLEEGLSQSQVTSFCQDTDGYLWFGTFVGANRFDGKNFDNYSTENGLLDDEINDLLLDADGAVWVANRGGICKFNGYGFEAYPLAPEHAEIKVTSITQDGDGIYWIGTDGLGVFQLRNQEFIHVVTADSSVRDILYCTDGNLRVGTRTGIEVYNGRGFVADTTTSGLSVSVLLDDGNGVWIGTRGQGLVYDQPDARTYYNREDGLISSSIRDLCMDQNGVLWITTKVGLSKLSGDTLESIDQKNIPFDPDLRCAGIDDENNLWIGTTGYGVLRFTGEAFVNYTINDGIGSNLVMGITEAPNGNLWFSTHDAGISRFDGDVFENYTLKDGVSNTTGWATTTDLLGNIWVTTSDGITMFDGHNFHTLTTRDGLPSNRSTAVCATSDSAVWFGTQGGVAVYRNGSITSYPSSENSVGKNVRAIIQARDGTIWAGSESGLYHFVNGSWSSDVYTEEDGLSANTIFSLAEDSRGNLWVGTEDGLNHFVQDTFTLYRPDEVYGSAFTSFLLVDTDQKLWIGTYNGLYSLSLDEFYDTDLATFNHFTRADGLLSLECNQNAAFQDNDGYLWFGTGGGLMRLDPSKIDVHKNLIAPRIHISDIKLFMRETEWSKYTAQIDMATGIPQSLAVRHSQNHFTFYFTGIYHSNPNKLEYQYMLEGFDDTWQPITRADFATYSYLPFGQYTFRVRAGNGNGVWSEEAATFSFEILPPFWMTWWFYTLNAFVFISLVTGIWIWRVRVLRRKAATVQLQYRSKMMALEQQTLNASMNRHFIFNALNSIQYYINRQDRLSANRYLSSFAKLVRKNLDSSTSGNLVALNEELERLKLYLDLEHMRFQNKFEYEIVVDESLNMGEILVPAMLLQPYVENSIWHGVLPKPEGGLIKIHFSRTPDNSLMIEISDNGIGIEQSRLRKNQDPDDRVSKGMDITAGRIKLLREMTNQNIYVKGPYEVKEPGGNPLGTKVEIVLPIDHAEMLNL